MMLKINNYLQTYGLYVNKWSWSNEVLSTVLNGMTRLSKGILLEHSQKMFSELVVVPLVSETQPPADLY